MQKDFYDKLRDKTKQIVKEGLRLAKNPPKDLCEPKCASCLVATARGNVDNKDFGFPTFDSGEDICMLEARDILAKKLNWKIN